MKKFVKKSKGRIFFVLAASAAMSGILGIYTLFFPDGKADEQTPLQIYAENADESSVSESLAPIESEA